MVVVEEGEGEGKGGGEGGITNYQEINVWRRGAARSAALTDVDRRWAG